MKRKSIIAISVCMVVLMLSVAGCCASTSSSSSPSTANPVSRSNDQGSSNAAASVTTKAVNTAAFTSAVKADVMTMKDNWDSDAEDDGIVIFPNLKDASDETVKWDGAILPVDVEIWTTDIDSNFKEQKDQLVYQGSGTIDSWEDGNFILGGGIRVPFEQIQLPSDKTYGWGYAKVHTPDGKTFEGVEKYASLTP